MTTRAEELKAIVDDAWAATANLGECEPAVRLTAFEQLLHFLLADSASQPRNGQSDAAAPASTSDQAEPLDSSYATEQQRAEAVGRFLHLEPEDALDLFNLTEPTPRLTLPAEKLPNSSVEAIRVIALLVCAARTALGTETGSADIRQVAEDYNRCDPDFADALTNMQELSVRGKSSSRNRLVRLRVIGIEAAQALAASLID